MNNARGYLLTWALCVVFLLSGCSGAWEATKKVGKVVMDPDIPVGAGYRSTLNGQANIAVRSRYQP